MAVKLEHPNYNETTFDFDFSLLKLTAFIRIDPLKKQFIKLPNENDFVRDNSLVFITGWGVTNFTYPNAPSRTVALQGVYLPTLSQQQCQKYYQNKYRITSQMICAAIPQKTVCHVSIYLNYKQKIDFYF